jgi:hypothetical protein
MVFNVKGNDYRLVAAVDFEKRIVWIKWIGTHADYDRIDVKKVELWKGRTGRAARRQPRRPARRGAAQDTGAHK